jgi:hypothetical protein
MGVLVPYFATKTLALQVSTIDIWYWPVFSLSFLDVYGEYKQMFIVLLLITQI